MDKKKLHSLVASILIGDRAQSRQLIEECAKNYSAERRETIQHLINKEMNEVERDDG